MELNEQNIVCWPAPLRRAVDSIAVRVWQRFTLFAWKLDWIQRRLDGFREWYNSQRPMWIHAGRTPEEVYRSIPKLEALPAWRCDPPIALCSVRRVHAVYEQ